MPLASSPSGRLCPSVLSMGAAVTLLNVVRTYHHRHNHYLNTKYLFFILNYTISHVYINKLRKKKDSNSTPSHNLPLYVTTAVLLNEFTANLIFLKRNFRELSSLVGMNGPCRLPLKISTMPVRSMLMVCSSLSGTSHSQYSFLLLTSMIRLRRMVSLPTWRDNRRGLTYTSTLLRRPAQAYPSGQCIPR